METIIIVTDKKELERMIAASIKLEMLGLEKLLNVLTGAKQDLAGLQYLKLKEASELFGIPISRLRRFIQMGMLPAIKEGKGSCTIVKATDVEEFIANNKIKHNV
jgi:Helix-turn-helix domain